MNNTMPGGPRHKKNAGSISSAIMRQTAHASVLEAAKILGENGDKSATWTMKKNMPKKLDKLAEGPSTKLDQDASFDDTAFTGLVPSASIRNNKA